MTILSGYSLFTVMILIYHGRMIISFIKSCEITNLLKTLIAYRTGLRYHLVNHHYLL